MAVVEGLLGIDMNSKKESDSAGFGSGQPLLASTLASLRAAETKG